MKKNITSDLTHFYILVKVTSNFHKLPNTGFKFSFFNYFVL